jgi:hypothetical protein
MMSIDLNSKRLQLLKEMIPQLTRAAVMWNPDRAVAPPTHVVRFTTGFLLRLRLITFCSEYL